MHDMHDILEQLEKALTESVETEKLDFDISDIEFRGEAKNTLINLLAVMDYLGSVGSSRTIQFSFDGDGPDRIIIPNLKVDDEIIDQIGDASSTGKTIYVHSGGVKT